MKPMLPWVIVIVLSACCIRLLVAKKAERVPVAGSALDVTHEPFNQGEAKTEVAVDADKRELMELRKENADLLKLRNEVRSLREENTNYKAQVQALYQDLRNARISSAQAAVVKGNEQQLGGGEIRREIVGIGIMLVESGGAIIIRQVLEGSPAEKAGVTAGGTLLSVDGVTPANATLPQLAELIRGQEGSQVVIEFDNAQGERRRVSLVRETIKLGEK